MTHNSLLRLSGLALLTGSLATPALTQSPIRITADLTDAPRKLYHAEIDLPVKPGPAAVTTPQWIPGNHRPTGPVDDITGVVFTANGKTLPWRRDDTHLYQFHVTVPSGVPAAPRAPNFRPKAPPEVSNLVREVSSAYASHHYHVYHFLLTLSDVAGGEGLEHGQSSDNGVEEQGFADARHQVYNADLLS